MFTKNKFLLKVGKSDESIYDRTDFEDNLANYYLVVEFWIHPLDVFYHLLENDIGSAK